MLNDFLHIDDSSATLTKRIVNASLSADCSCVNPYMGVFPCGQCANCLANRQRLWVYRIESECAFSSETLGVCLTYTDEMLRSGVFLTTQKKFNTSVVVPIPIYASRLDYKTSTIKEYRVPYTNEFIEGDSLQYKDYQCFMKRLRKKYEGTGVTIRYFVKGEYGGKNFRPHYHAILHFKDPQNQFTRLSHIKNVASAWFDACVQYRGEKRPLLSREENAGKYLKVNPILEIEDISSDCARYCAKYTSKFSLATVCPMALACPEFQYASNGYGMDYLNAKVEEIRSKIDLLINDFYSGKLSDENGILDIKKFRDRFDDAVTFYGISKSGVVLPFRMPQYLKRRVLEGYWYYENSQRREVRKNGEVDKIFRSPRSVREKYKQFPLIPLYRATNFSKLSHLRMFVSIFEDLPLSSVKIDEGVDGFSIGIDLSCYYETDEKMQEILGKANRLEHYARERRTHFFEICERRKKGALKHRIEESETDKTEY